MVSELIKKLNHCQSSYNNEDLLACSTDASGVVGSAALCVWPESIDEVIQVIEEAKKSGLDLAARGAGTGLVGGCVPQNSLVIDFSKMNQIIEVNENDKTAMVQPGVVLDQLNEFLKKYNLVFPVIPGSHSVCTLGGMAATNAAGIWSLKFGRMSDWVEELWLVDGNGEIINISGDEIKEIVGSEGLNGLMVKMKLKLVNKIEETYVIMASGNNVADLLAMVGNWKKIPGLLSLEFISPLIASRLGLEEKYYLFAEIEGPNKSEVEVLKFWHKREGIAPIMIGSGYPIIEDPLVPESGVKEMLDWFSKNAVPVFGHIGVGIFHPHFRPEEKEKIKEMYALVNQLGGKVSGEHGIGLKKKQFLDNLELKYRRDLKNKFDPSGIFNRGKVI
ncbi:MAG: FAD-binding oxidoreductase [Patescibacteria group bacterium]